MHRSTIQSMLLALALAALSSAHANAASAAPAATGAVASPHAATGPTAAAPQQQRAPAPPAKLVDINRASRKDLMTLPGIGTAEANKIVANRPYLTKTELVDKQVLPLGPYLSLKNRLIALPMGRSMAKAPAKS